MRKAKTLAGVTDVELNVPTATKKRLAINLDRTNQSLDGLYGLPKRCGRVPHICGTSAPFMLMRSGIPIVSYGFATPSHPILSLAVQKALGFKNVKSIRMSGFSAAGGAAAIPIVLIHDVNLYMVVELPIYTLFLSGVAGGTNYLYDEISRKSVPVKSDGTIDWASKAKKTTESR